MISSRLPRDLALNRVSRTVEERRASGRPLVDLTLSNPTKAGFDYPEDLLQPLANAAALQYEPQALGLATAREAVSREYARQGMQVDSSRIALTSSTSEAYALLFKLFCNPGDVVLVPQPSYPLFEHLTQLEAVEIAPYRLEYHGTWRVDIESVHRALTPRTRMLLVVSPNNPTGSCLHQDDLTALADICATHDLPLVGDEVFADYLLDPAPGAVPVLSQSDVLTCALGGLSKSAALPQVKLGWIAWGGPPVLVAGALHAFEIVADSYLSVSTPVQLAAPALIERGGVLRQQVQARIRRNLDTLRHACAAHPSTTLLRVEGGWSAVVQVPAVRSEEDLVVTLVEQDGVVVHPGYFFDFPKEAFLVPSLLVEPAAFNTGMARVLARASGVA